MNAWWGSLGTSLKIFYAIGFASGLVLLVQLAALMLGIDADHHDGGLDHGEAGVGPLLSVRAFTAFFAGFGWTGVAMVRAGYSVPAATAGAVGMGSVFMGAVVAIMRLLYGMAHSGTVDYQNAVGQSATVYVPIAANMEKAGQVEVLVQDRLRTVAAMTRAERVLPSRSRVRVVALLDPNTLLVEPE